MTIKRELESEFRVLLTEYPVVTILGPRQSGKTTLAKIFLEKYTYINLEEPETRSRVIEDPKGFFKQLPSYVIFDEIQRVPELLSYIQVDVDKNNESGRFILTGSHQLKLAQAITQSLAGRTALLHLFPFTISELSQAGIEFKTYEDYVLNGFLPRIYDKKIRPSTAYSNYYQTYVERDVRQLINIKNYALFEKFIKLLAGRVGQIINYTSLGNDVGVDQKTIKDWLSVLEASFVIYKLSPYFENFGKRVIKSPKYYFVDVGLLTYLLGIEEVHQISRDPLVGSLFENLVVMDLVKTQLNKGKTPNLYFFRDTKGNEIDLIYQFQRKLVAVEIKSSSTYTEHLTKTLLKMKESIPEIKKVYLVYNGTTQELPKKVKSFFFKEASTILELDIH